MSAFWGMAPHAAQAQAERLDGAGSRLEELRSALDGTVARVAWAGADAEAFRMAWATDAGARLSILSESLRATGRALSAEVEQQEGASEAEGPGPAADRPPRCAPPSTSTIPPAIADDRRDDGYLAEDSPWIPGWLEDPVEAGMSWTAQTASDGIGWGFDTAMDGLGGLGDGLGLRTDGLEQMRRDADHLGSVLTDLATGERVPTISELVSSAAVATISAGVGGHELITGEDTPLLDDRPGDVLRDGQGRPVMRTETEAGPARSLGDLIIENDSLRMPGTGPQDHGQIGIQRIRPADGGDPVYIVQIPPTEGASLGDVPGAYGGQGNARDWGSNLRLVAGQHPAAMDEVRAAMGAAGVPPGASVMMVGHSQGGIIATHLAADPTFNSSCGEPGTYNVTTTFSVGSPVQTVVPAQAGTQVVNVTHGPEGLDPHVIAEPRREGPFGIVVPTDIGYTGDPIAHLDLQGAQLGGGSLQSPNVHEVIVEGSAGRLSQGKDPLFDNHDSYDPDDPTYGYHPDVVAATGTDPVLSALQRDLTGRYIGPGVVIEDSTVVDVGRGPR